MNYHEALTEAMARLAQRPNVVFVGQGVSCKSTTMSSTFRDVPLPQRLEMPVAEEMQMGMCIGMALQGYLPVCVFPRWNFMLRAADQIVNHLDRLPIYSRGGYRPKVIIRTAVPSTEPFDPQSQHDDDFGEAFGQMLRTVEIEYVFRESNPIEIYERAAGREASTIISEYTEFYKNARAST